MYVDVLLGKGLAAIKVMVFCFQTHHRFLEIVPESGNFLCTD